MTCPKRVLARYLKAVTALQSVGVGLPVPDVDQSPGMCGPAALRAVAGFYGRDVSEAEIARLAGSTEKDGTKPEALIRAAKALGFQAALRDCASIQDIQSWLDHGIPVIVDWFSVDDGHYSVVKSIEDGMVYMMDPEPGRETEMPADSFERTWFDFRPGEPKRKGLVERRMIVVWP